MQGSDHDDEDSDDDDDDYPCGRNTALGPRRAQREREREPDHYDDDDTDHDAGTADIVPVIMQGHVSGEASGDDDAGGVEVDDPYSHISNSSRSGNNYLRVAQSWQLQRNKCRRRRRAGRSGRIRHEESSLPSSSFKSPLSSSSPS